MGIGEGAYGPVAPAMISDYYPVAVRGRVLAWFYAAIPVGGALGYALGGYVASLDPARQSWRWAFYGVVVPGLLLGPVVLPETRSPARGRRPAGRSSAAGQVGRLPGPVPHPLLRAEHRRHDGHDLRHRRPGLVDARLPGGASRRGAVLGLEPRTFFGVETAVAGLIATLSGGAAGDWLRGRYPGSYFLVSGAGLLVAAPCTLGFLLAPFPLAWVFVFLAVFFLFFNTGPSNTILANVTHPSMRATGFALNILVIHTLGDAISPPVVGAIADRWSLTAGFVVVSAFMLLGGLLWLWGARYLERDTAAAPHLLD